MDIYIGIFSLTPTFITVYVRYRCAFVTASRGANERDTGGLKNARICVIRQKRKRERKRKEEGKRATVHSLVRISIGISIQVFVKVFVILLHDVKHVSYEGRASKEDSKRRR